MSHHRKEVSQEEEEGEDGDRFVLLSPVTSTVEIRPQAPAKFQGGYRVNLWLCTVEKTIISACCQAAFCSVYASCRVCARQILYVTINLVSERETVRMVWTTLIFGETKVVRNNILLIIRLLYCLKWQAIPADFSVFISNNERLEAWTLRPDAEIATDVFRYFNMKKGREPQGGLPLFLQYSAFLYLSSLSLLWLTDTSRNR